MEIHHVLCVGVDGVVDEGNIRKLRLTLNLINVMIMVIIVRLCLYIL